MRPRLLDRLRDSLGILRAHPFVSVGLGVAILLSLGAVCCGLGVVAAPWFSCELAALQLGAATGRRPDRTPSWIGAAMLQAVAVVVVSVGAWISATALGGELPGAEPEGHGAGGLAFVGLALAGGTIGVFYLAPFVYAPAILIDRGGALGNALVDSARFVVSGGFFRHVGFSFVAHAVQVAPAAVAAAIALGTRGLYDLPLALAVAVPFVAVTVPLGQGMIVSAYAARRAEIPRAGTVPHGYAPPRLLAATLIAVAVLPAIALLLVGASLVTRPSRPSPGRAPDGELVLAARIGEGSRTLYVPETTLSIEASHRSLAIAASDGGGAGRVPLPEGAHLDALRIVRVRSDFALELDAGGRRFVTWFDGAGVRLDDDLAARLADHLPPLGLWVVVLIMVLGSTSIAFALRPIGEVRREAALPAAERPPPEILDRRHALGIRQGWLTALALVMPALLSAWLSLVALGF